MRCGAWASTGDYYSFYLAADHPERSEPFENDYCIRLGDPGARLGDPGGLKRFSGSAMHRLNKTIIAVL
jgi:hypothetical protein